ncbi:MAG: 16S rRNA (guanine(966)-N(2))-methyltransferase RsmD [Propionibacteriaceae bacterium]|jgi:16S rRNA (guanine966-N2)-methyltransferase|nr:16S rRNA (guanine(966)-N(2))-methyltransferase RsmD [Propionibacteriaceae bacterium]
MSRIIAGMAKGKTLRAPKGDATRPTTDRLREALFSTLAAWVGVSALTGSTAEQLDGLSFLDLYAGSGAVGLEAASRGAGPVTLVESNAATARLIRDNAASTNLQANVVVGSVERFLAATSTVPGYDVVFLDPPYEVSNETITEVVTSICAHGWLAREGLVVVERSGRTPPPVWPDGLSVPDVKRYGESVVFLLEEADAGAGTKGELK